MLNSDLASYCIDASLHIFHRNICCLKISCRVHLVCDYPYYDNYYTLVWMCSFIPYHPYKSYFLQFNIVSCSYYGLYKAWKCINKCIAFGFYQIPKFCVCVCVFGGGVTTNECMGLCNMLSFLHMGGLWDIPSWQHIKTYMYISPGHRKCKCIIISSTHIVS